MSKPRKERKPRGPMTWAEAEAIRREAEANQDRSRAEHLRQRQAKKNSKKYPTLDDGSKSVPAIPSAFETNRRRH